MRIFKNLQIVLSKNQLPLIKMNYPWTLEKNIDTAYISVGIIQGNYSHLCILINLNENIKKGKF